VRTSLISVGIKNSIKEFLALKKSTHKNSQNKIKNKRFPSSHITNQMSRKRLVIKLQRLMTISKPKLIIWSKLWNLKYQRLKLTATLSDGRTHTCRHKPTLESYHLRDLLLENVSQVANTPLLDTNHLPRPASQPYLTFLINLFQSRLKKLRLRDTNPPLRGASANLCLSLEFCQPDNIQVLGWFKIRIWFHQSTR
jgi:hypothetical protein